MINPFDYLYYKTYKAWSFFTGGEYPIGHLGALAMILGLNVLSIYVLIFNKAPSAQYYIGIVVGIIIILLVCYRSTREAKIISKFNKESEKSRIIGTVAVILYVVLSIWIFFLV